MTLSPLPGFRSLETHHCITGSVRHVYEYHSYPITEELLLGLGAGVGFLYWHQTGTDPFYGGRANFERPGVEGLERTVGRRTGVAVESHRSSSPRRARRSLLEILEAGRPVMITVDMGYLPYLDLPDDYHFGAHAVVVAGYDSDSDQVLITDRDAGLHPVSMDVLAKARGSTFKPFPPQYQWNTFDFANKRAPTPDEIRQAIREVCDGMLAPPISNLGVRGIRTAAKRTLQWPGILDPESLRRTCFNIFIFIDAAGGTCGGIFRYMYGRFLREAADLTTEPRLSEIGTEMVAIGDRWQDVSAVFRQASEAPDPAALLSEATSRMEAIAEIEQRAWESLQAVIGA